MRNELLTAGLYYSASKKSQRPHPVLRRLHPPAPESVRSGPRAQRGKETCCLCSRRASPTAGARTRLQAGGDSAPARATASTRQPKGTARTSRPRPSVLPTVTRPLPCPPRCGSPARQAACTSPASNPLVLPGQTLILRLSRSPVKVTRDAARPDSRREDPSPPLRLGGSADPRDAASPRAQTPARPAQGCYLRRETLPGLSIN